MLYLREHPFTLFDFNNQIGIHGIDDFCEIVILNSSNTFHLQKSLSAELDKAILHKCIRAFVCTSKTFNFDNAFEMQTVLIPAVL